MSQTTITRKANRFPGRCNECGLHVASEAGYLVGKNKASGPWLVAHNVCPHPELVKLYNPTTDEMEAEADLAADDAIEAMSTQELLVLVDGMSDTLACRSEVGDCIDYEDPEEVAKFDAGTAKMVNEIDAAIALLRDRGAL